MGGVLVVVAEKNGKKKPRYVRGGLRTRLAAVGCASSSSGDSVVGAVVVVVGFGVVVVVTVVVFIVVGLVVGRAACTN